METESALRAVGSGKKSEIADICDPAEYPLHYVAAGVRVSSSDICISDQK